MTKILVIDDEHSLCTEVVDWLTFEGYEAIGAKDGEEGIAFATFYQPDLIISDITMPGVDGYGVLMAVSAVPQTMGTPFIFLTARSAHEDFRKGMELGADDYITKPFSRLELLRAVESRLMKREVQKRAQQQEIRLLKNSISDLHERHMLQSKLLRMFSHDFHNPITSILLTSNLLRTYGEHMSSARRQGHLARIESAAHLLQQMLDDVLVVNQIEKGSFVVQPEKIVIGRFLDRIIHVFKAISDDKYHFALDYADQETILADPRLLRQIATNLISNAIKYSEAGSEVKVTLRKDGEAIRLLVEDEGIGIPAADLHNLFEAFQRGSNVARIDGTGLGLAIVKQAVDLHDGTVELESEVDVGTKVQVILPQIGPSAQPQQR